MESIGQKSRSGDNAALERRVFRTMIATVALAVVAGVTLASGRVTTGLLLGGLLSLLNYHWLRSSIASALNIEARPRVKIFSYIVRYFVISGAVFAAYNLGVISLPATLAGLCSFVPALFVEAFRQFYLAILHRGESY